MGWDGRGERGKEERKKSRGREEFVFVGKKTES